MGCRASSITPLGSDAFDHGSMSSNAFRSPSMEISICSPLAVPPETPPRGRMLEPNPEDYSPSAGKLCTTEIPPRVPYGAPSARSHWESRLDSAYLSLHRRRIRIPNG